MVYIGNKMTHDDGVATSHFSETAKFRIVNDAAAGKMIPESIERGRNRSSSIHPFILLRDSGDFAESNFNFFFMK